MSRLLAVVCLVSAAVSASAATKSVWTDTTSASANWTDASKWQDGSGQPLGTYPNGDYDATLSPMADSKIQTIEIGDNSYSLKSLALQSLIGDERHTVSIHVPDNRRTTYSPAQMPVHLSVADPNGFVGYLRATEANAWLDFDTPAEAVPTFAHVSASQYLHANVTNGVEKAGIGELYGGGVLVKEGPGALAVRRGTGADNVIRLAAGSLELGEEAVDVEALLKTAVFRFDADRADTLLTEVRADGRSYVTNWFDANGGAIVALPPTYQGFNPPYLAPEKSPTGRTLVDFGDVKTYATTLPTNCYLRLSRKITTGREFFYAGQFRRRAWNPIFGIYSHWDYRPFNMEPSNIYNMVNASPDVYNGILYLNGEKRAANYIVPGRAWYRMHVFSTSALGPINWVDALCTDGGENINRGERTGGVILGEAILFDFALTPAQRTALNRYLMTKWMGSGDLDVGTVQLATADGEISVPANVEAKVGTVVAGANTLIKTGAGVLTVQTVQPTNAAIRVEGGSVRFAGVTADVTTDAPASDALLWLDATVGPFTYDHDNFITNWYDRRQDAAYNWYARAPRASDDSRARTANLPFLETNARGLQVVNFGVYNADKALNTSSWMGYESGNATTRRGYVARTCFLVFAANKSSFDGPIFSSSHSMWNRNYYTRFLHEKTKALGDMLAATWREDGVVVDPCERVYRTKADGTKIPDCYLAGEWHVVSFSAEELLASDLLCGPLGFETLKCGSLTVGELIMYDRRLTAEEHRNTEAYLMQKWLGKAHPDVLATKSPAPALSYGATVSPTFDTDADMTLPSLNGGNGHLVKKGTGTVTVNGFSTEKAVSSVDVAEGKLVLAYTDEGGSFLTPSYHFDAKVGSSITTYPGDDGKTYVSKWTSTGTCLYNMEACRYSGDKLKDKSGQPAEGSVVDPTLGSCEMRPGVTRPYLDFGKMSKTGEWGYLNAGSAGFRINEVGQDGSSVPYNMCWCLSEVYAIVADADTRSSPTEYCTFFGTANRNDYRNDFYRGASGALFGGGAKQGVRDGYMAIDGEVATKDSVLPSGFHLVSVQPVVTNTAVDRYRADAIGLDRNVTAGGMKIAELIAYKADQHTPRQRTFIEQSLMHKWFGTPEAKWNHDIPSVTVADGATLKLDGPDVAFTVSELAGAGTVEADRISGVSSLVFKTDPSASAILPLTVDGTLALADTGTVTISGDRIRFTGDRVLLLTADTLEDVDLRFWTVDFPSAKPDYGFRLVREDNSLYLNVTKPGVLLIVR